MVKRVPTAESLKRRVYLSIFEKIVRNEFPVEVILKEGELAGLFRVSKAPVREALIELCNENVLQSIPRAGYRIIQLTERDFREAEDLRTLLELEGLRRIESVEAGALEKLAQTIAESKWRSREKRDVTVDVWWHNNMTFHLTLNALAGNRLLTQALERALNLQRRVLAQLFWDTPMSYLYFESPYHQVILDALRAGDRALAEQTLRRDLRTISNRLSEVKKGI